MKLKLPVCLSIAALAFVSVFATLASAQMPPPNVEAQFQNILAEHPDAAANPGLLRNPGWLRQHPNVNKFLADHPNVRRQIAAGDLSAWGAYDEGHVWHPASWWHENHPDWVYQNHPEWAEHYGWAQADYRAHPDWFHHKYWQAHPQPWLTGVHR
jgi:hypothetical protein